MVNGSVFITSVPAALPLEMSWTMVMLLAMTDWNVSNLIFTVQHSNVIIYIPENMGMKLVNSLKKIKHICQNDVFFVCCLLNAHLKAFLQHAVNKIEFCNSSFFESEEIASIILSHRS